MYLKGRGGNALEAGSRPFKKVLLAGMVAFHKLPYASQRLQSPALMSVWQRLADHAQRGSLPHPRQYHKEQLKP